MFCLGAGFNDVYGLHGMLYCGVFLRMVLLFGFLKLIVWVFDGLGDGIVNSVVLNRLQFAQETCHLENNHSSSKSLSKEIVYKQSPWRKKSHFLLRRSYLNHFLTSNSKSPPQPKHSALFQTQNPLNLGIPSVLFSAAKNILRGQCLANSL